MKRIEIRVTMAIALLLLITIIGEAQTIENDFQLRTSVKLSIQPIKRLTFSLTPEVRFDENIQLDQYLFEGEAAYNPLKFISAGASFRLTGNQNNRGEMIYSTRFAVFAETEKKFYRFTPTLRLCYTNSDDDESNDNFLRYKAGISYNVKNCKLTPMLSVEAFHDLTNANIAKMRYSAGISYKLFKNNSIGIDYKLDYYLQEYRNKHIVSIGYKIKF